MDKGSRWTKGCDGARGWTGRPGPPGSHRHAMHISEIYKSVQGEGLLTGTQSVFVRTSGCNLRCHYCDTPFASWEPEGQAMEIHEIVAFCREEEGRHVVLTGGEPMLQREIVELTRELSRAGMHITIETAGTLDRPVICDLMSISPKMSNSTPDRQRAGPWTARHEAARHRPDVIRRLTDHYPFQIKFVVDRPGDCQEIQAWLKQFPHLSRDRILLMPQGTQADELQERQAWLEEICQAEGFGFCPRMHIHWFGNRRGT